MLKSRLAKKLRSSISTVLAASMLLSVFPAGMLHLPSFSIFSDNVITDATSQDPGTVACLQKTMTDSSGNKYTFYATCAADSGIPSDAELDVKEIPAGDEYDAYLADTQAALESDAIGYAHFFDISIVKDGVELQPEDGSKVNMQIILEDADTEDLNVVHFPEAPGNGSAEVVENTTSSEGESTVVGFDAEGFSVYGIVSTIVTTTIQASDGNTYKITATFTESSGIPSDAQLKVTEVDDSDYAGYLTSATKALGESIHSVSYGKFFDISLVKDGVSYQPVDGSTVKVKVELLDTENVDDVKVVHFEGNQAEELSASTKGTTVSFETDGFSVFSFLDFSLISRLVTATIDKAVSSSGTKSGPLYSNDDIIISGSVPSTGIVEAKRVDVSVDGKNALVAYDIKIYANELMKLLGISWQPSESALQVQFKSDALKTDSVDVYHMEDTNSSAELVSGNIDVKDKSVIFNANSFSVYVVIEHEGGEIITPRVEFHYIGRDYQENNSGSGYSYTAPAYEFLNKHNEYQVSQILRDGETLEQIVNPPNKKDNTGHEVSFFYGWYTVDASEDSTAYNTAATASPYYNGSITYTWMNPLKVDDQTAISITPVDENGNGKIETGESVTWSIGETTGTAVLDAEGTAHVYIAPVYEDYYFVNFHMGNKEADEALRNNLLTRRLVVFGQNNSAVVRIGDVQGPSPDPAHEIFAGWETADFSDPSNPQTILYYETLDNGGTERDILHNGTSETAGASGSGYRITVNKSGSTLSSLDLYPIFAEARWVLFNTGENGNGSTYVGSQYRLTNDEDKGTYFTAFPTSSRPGYTFKGWYLSQDSNFNGTGVQITDETGAFVNAVKGQSFYGIVDPTTGNITSFSTNASAGPKVFEINSAGELYLYKALDSITVYANWEAKTVNYTVVYWLENADDNNYTLIHYDDTLDGIAGDMTAATQLAEESEPYTKNKLKFAHLSSDQDKDAAGVQSGIQQQVIEGDGSTIVNIYYDRDVYRLRFDIGFARRTSTNGTTTTYTSMTPSEAQAYSGTVYGVENGSYKVLTPDGNGGWSYYAEVRHDYTGDRYLVANNNNGTQYGIVNGNLQQIYYRRNQWRITDTNNGTQYTGTRYTQGAGDTYNLGFVNGSMQTLSHDEQGWFYYAEGTTLSPYTGTLYKQESMAGTWQYSVSNITGPNYAENNTWKEWLTQNRIDLGTTNPFGPDEYNGTYETTVNGTPYIVYYYEIEAKYGEVIMDRYPGTQPARSGAGPFVGWLPQRDSFYTARLSTSIKGIFETMSEDLILTGGTPPRYNSADANVSPENYKAITVDENNTSTGEHGITQEFRCRYNRTGDTVRAYLYRIYLADVETRLYTTEPTYKSIVVGGSGSSPNKQTPPTFQGYTLVDTKVLTSANDTTGAIPSGTNYSYAVPELAAASVNNGNGAIMVFRFMPNQHQLSYMYGSGVDSSLVATEVGSPEVYNYGQSLTNADRYTDVAEAATPNGYSFIGWFENPDGVGNAFDFNTTMPDGNVILYACYKPLKYRIKIDPNGGEIDHIDHTGASYAGTSYYTDPFVRPANSDGRPQDTNYDKSQSTYFNGRFGEEVGEYTVSRTYVPIGDVAAETYSGCLYYYVNGQYASSDGSGLPADLRNALYIDITDGTGMYVNDDSNQGYTELYLYYKFWHEWAQTEMNQKPTEYPGMTAQNLSFDAWKNLYVAKQKDGTTPQIYRKTNSKETWVFLGWFTDGSTMPYDFTTPITGPLTLTAHWRLDGGYTIQYTPEYWLDSSDGNRYMINGEMNAWIDPDPNATTGAFSYTDGALTTVYKQPTDLTKNGQVVNDNSVNFLGWRVVSVSTSVVNGQTIQTYTPLEDGVLYDPGDDFTIDVQFADSNNIIHMQAVYEETNSSVRRPNIANLTLDANGGVVTDGADNELTDDANISWSGVGTILEDAINDTVVFGDIQSNAAIHLYKYATNDSDTGLTGGTNYFKHVEGFFLLGFDVQPDPESIVWVDPQNDAITGAAQPYVPNYPADSVISVQRTDDKTLYAIWEPLVYMTFENKTQAKITFTLSSSSDALEVINVKNGMYDRTPLTSDMVIELKAGEDITLAFPKGAEKLVTISGTNNLGPGKVLMWDTSIALQNDRTYSTRPAVDPDPNNNNAEPDASFEHTVNGSTHTHVLASGEKTNLQDFSFDEKLLVNKNPLTVTFTSRDNAFALLLDDNWDGGGMQEFDYGLNDIRRDPDTNEPKGQDLPNTSTRLGYSFLGWAYDKNATVPDFPEQNMRIDNLSDIEVDGFFNPQNTVRVNDVETRTLYAVWEPLKDAVYIYKEVPAPGNQSRPFDFTLAITGSYHTGSNTYQINSSTNQYTADTATSKTFSIKHNEYLRIVTTDDYATVSGHTTAFVQAEVEVYYPVTQNGSVTYVKDNARSAIVRWERNGLTPGTNNGFGTDLKITVTEAQVTHYTTSVMLDYEEHDYQLALGGQTFAASSIPQTVGTREVSWTNPDAHGTVTYTNEIDTYDVSVMKTLIRNNSDTADFNFTASYILDKGTSYATTVEKFTDASPFVVTSGTTNAVALKDIPAGAELTIIEEQNDDYTTTIYKDGVKTVDDGKTIVLENVTADSTVVYTNTLKSYPAKFIKVDQAGTPGVVAATFNLVNTTGKYNIGSNLQAYDNAGSDGVFYVSGADNGSGVPYEPLYAGQTYTLTETFTESGYLGLNGPVTITVSGDENDPFTISNPDVTAEWDNTNKVWIFRVKNVEKKDITIVKAFNDPLLNQRTFKFSWSYKYDSDRNGAIDTATEVFTGAFTLSPFTGSSANTKISVPVGATDLVVTELHTNEGTDQYAWVATAYDTTFRLNNGTDTAGYAYTILSVSDEATITFTNTRKTVDVTVKKEVVGEGGTFDFESLLSYSAAIGNYTLNNNGTASDTTDDLITGTDGKAVFSLSPAKNGEDTIVLTVPYGAYLTVTETSTGPYTTAVQVGTQAQTANLTTGQLTITEDITITFTNSEVTIAPTGYEADSTPYMWIFLLGLMILIAMNAPFLYLRKKRREED